MIDSMFQSGTDQALDDMVRRPRPDLPPQEGFSVLGALRGIPRGIAGGAADTLAFGAEITGAFGDVQGAMGYSAGGMFSTQTEKEKQQTEQARRKLLDSGPSFSNEAGDIFRTRAKEIMPDPTSTHASEQVIAGVAQFATKAIGYSLTTGPVAPFLLGVDVGMAESDKLKQEGVDLATRTKAGAVAGVAAGASIAIPVAVPSSIAKTTAAVAVGGPGTFVAQNAAERSILKHAGYDKIADQYDPFDPVGLALSTVVPAGFGAWAVRGARVSKPATTIHQVVQDIESNGRRYGKDGKILEGPMTKHGTAKGEMQVIDTTNLDPGFGVRPAADNSPAERARVGRDYLDAMLKRYGGDEAQAMAAYNAGPGALDKALARAKKEGGEWLRFMPEETRNYVAKGMDRLQDGRIGAVADTDAVAAARVRQTAQMLDRMRLTPDDDLAGMNRHQQAVERAHDQMAAGEPVRVGDLMTDPAARDFAQWFEGSRVTDAQGMPLRVFHGTPADFHGFDPARAGEFGDNNGHAVYFSSSPEVASGYSVRYANNAEWRANAAESARLVNQVAEVVLKHGKKSDEFAKVKAALDENAAQRRVLEEQINTHAAPADGANVRPSLLSLKNPLEVDAGGKLFHEVNADAIQRARDGGHDGVVIRNVVDHATEQSKIPSDVYVAFDAASVRSTFDAPRLEQFARAMDELNTARMDADSTAATARSGESVSAAESTTGKGGADQGAAIDSALDKSADQLAADMPDLMVQLDGMDSPVRVADLLERVKAEAKDDVEASMLLDVAATCALRIA